MAKMTVSVNGGAAVKVGGVNAAYNRAGDLATAMLRDPSTPLGATIVVARDGVPTLTRTLVEVRACGKTIRSWEMT